jgi:hypothetical protein
MPTNTAKPASIPFGPGVTVFDPSDSVATINDAMNAAAGSGTNGGHREFYFMPGTYGDASQAPPQIAGVPAGTSPTSAQMLAAANAAGIISAPIGDNTVVAGLGESPCDVVINGALFVQNGGLIPSFQALENMTLNPIEANTPAHTMHWGTSQGAVSRRVNFLGNVEISDLETGGGPSYGALFDNSNIVGKILGGNTENVSTSPVEPTGSGGQGNNLYNVQDSRIGGFSAYGLLYQFSGVEGAPRDDFGPGSDGGPGGDISVLDEIPVVREPPFVYWDSATSSFKVFSPNAQYNQRGFDWTANAHTGTILPLSSFYIANPATDTAATLQAQLNAGKNLLLNPGTYNLSAMLTISRRNHVVLGLGIADLLSAAGVQTLRIADAATNTVLTGLQLDGTAPADPSTAPEYQVQIGVNGGTGSSQNPTTLDDVDVASAATTGAVINQDNVIWDESESGTNGAAQTAAAWATDAYSYGVVVNGDHVTLQSLYVEGHKKTQITWNGNDGQVEFLEDEPPYFPYYPTPNVVPSTWEMNADFAGWPGVMISSKVTKFSLDGYVTNQIFENGCDCQMTAAIVTPLKAGIQFRNVIGADLTYPVAAGSTLVQYDPNEFYGENGQLPKFFQPVPGLTTQDGVFSGTGGFISQLRRRRAPARIRHPQP